MAFERKKNFGGRIFQAPIVHSQICNLHWVGGFYMHKYILAIMTCLILLKAISADPVKAAENPEQKEMQQQIEQHFRTKAEHFGLKTEGKDLKEVRKEITIIEEAKKRENVWKTAQTLRIQTEGKTIDELIKDVRRKVKK